MSPDSITRFHCNACGHQTKHLVRHVEVTEWTSGDDGDDAIGGTDTYRLLRCAGCDSIALQHESYFDLMDDVRFYRYPPTISRRAPDWLGELSWGQGEAASAVAKLLKEIYVALRNDSPRLAAMGIRAVVERIMIDKVGDKGSIGANVAAFVSSGYVPTKFAEPFREALIEAGHAAMHRGFAPDKKQMATLLDLTENLIAQIYVHPVQAAELGSKIPPRPGRQNEG